MLSTNELLDLARERAGNVTDYRVAKLVGINPNAMYNYRKGLSIPESPVAMRLAEVAGVDPAVAVFALNVARARTEEEREFWSAQLRRLDS
ncbi:hypothetical protein CDN99_25525 [Roseateles aquatilis]|uniref:HTH cro/C1-type domain-containing protein n=1 Tax=Roseateles aquatilis TaxID=431061 RepID=A0A246IVP3_9BURK|nr:hypothetical protein [Roseateles aquatilis]OWQ83829.1 hypothetical protein CDN99_25525 [Roseateles aquatilis]